MSADGGSDAAAGWVEVGWGSKPKTKKLSLTDTGILASEAFVVRCLPLGIVPLLLLASRAGVAQAPAPAVLPQLSPGAAYEEAMHPLEVTRHSVSNWSDTELAALTVTMGEAKSGCAARATTDFNGGDLIDLARLCSLGQSYPEAVKAAMRYLAAESAKPQKTQAYAILIDALLRLKDERDAMTYAQAMLDAVPYDTLTAETMEAAIDFMQFVYTPDALKLAVKREPLLLERLQATVATAAAPVAATPAYVGAEPPQSIHELYADGMMLAVLQQWSRAQTAEVRATVEALDAALPAQLTPDDFVPLATTRRRYAMLGQPLPDIAHPAHPADARKAAALHSLDRPDILPQLPAVNAITGLLLFPDWCAQCLRMDLKLPQTVFTVKGHEAYLYGLLAPTVAQTPLPARATKPQPGAKAVAFTPADASNLLTYSATLVGDATLLEEFAVSDVPVLILTDSQGIVRVLQAVSDDAVAPGGAIDSAIALVGDTWPSPKLAGPAAKRTNR